MDTLKSMFPSFDDEVLFMLLQQNSYEVGPTIEVLLSMSEAEDNTPFPTGASTAPVTVNEGPLISFDDDESSAQAPGPANSGADFTITDEEETPFYEQQALRLAAMMEAQSLPAGASAPPAGTGRANAPDGLEAAQSVSDEQLAFMLANDALFQQELAAYFGEDFMLQEYWQQHPEEFGEDATGPAAATRVPGGSGSGSGSGDLGVVRGLAEIGSEMRSALNRFTLRYMSDSSRADGGAVMQRQGSSGSEGSWLGGGGTDNDVELVGIARSTSGGDRGGFSESTRAEEKPCEEESGSERRRQAGVAGLDLGAATGSDELLDDDDDDMETINLLGSPHHQPAPQTQVGSLSTIFSFGGNKRK
jgi:hypothetical protein